MNILKKERAYMLSTELKVKVIEVSVIVVIIAIAAYLGDLINLQSALMLCGIFGYGSVAALRELFLSKGVKTKIVVIIGVLLTAVLGYGSIVGWPWATTEKLEFVLAIVFGTSILTLFHGVAKAGGRSVLS